MSRKRIGKRRMRRERRKLNQILTIHHRKPRSIGGESDPRNLSMVAHSNHNAWHTIFSNHSAQTIALIINEKFLDPDYEFVCKKRTR